MLRLNEANPSKKKKKDLFWFGKKTLKKMKISNRFRFLPTLSGMEWAVNSSKTSSSLEPLILCIWSLSKFSIDEFESCLISFEINSTNALINPECKGQRSMKLRRYFSGLIIFFSKKYLAIWLMLLPLVLQQYWEYWEKATTLSALVLWILEKINLWSYEIVSDLRI